MTTPMDDAMPSQPQQEWETVGDLLRGHVTRLAMVPDLKPEEVVYVLNAAAAAMIYDMNARTFDDRKALLGNQYGGNCEH